ncbi:MAG TPA: hypothetical protein VHS97_11870, partial [Isosphaeraceae bacterium]|nr:hypothetical protein [Isosphaeraceae bacterium]
MSNPRLSADRLNFSASDKSSAVIAVYYGEVGRRLFLREFIDSNPTRSIKVMTSRRMALAGILGSAVVALALLTMGS